MSLVTSSKVYKLNNGKSVTHSLNKLTLGTLRNPKLGTCLSCSERSIAMQPFKL